METMYVVKMRKYSSFAHPKPAFSFAHPSWHKGPDDKFSDKTRNQKIDNTRFTSLKFIAQQTALLHGFGGYFECKLYKDVMLSINPSTYSEGMFSWFPMYIPIRNPVRVRKGEDITALFWRHFDSKKVWYEWSVGTEGDITPIHNVNGQNFPVHLTV
jgi:protein arginine N-methyltransferase 5